MLARFLTCFCLLLVAACGGDFPRDPDGTLDHIRQSSSFRVGLVAPLAPGADVRALVDEVGQAAGAAPAIETGDAEPLLNRLKEGELDLVIGRFDKKSPWAREVTLGPPLRVEHHGRAEFHLAPVMRNGENAWISLVERAARRVAPEAS